MRHIIDLISCLQERLVLCKMIDNNGFIVMLRLLNRYFWFNMTLRISCRMKHFFLSGRNFSGRQPLDSI